QNAVAHAHRQPAQRLRQHAVRRHQRLQREIDSEDRKSGGSEATFSGMSHVVHYDLIFKTTRNTGKVQLFAAVGGGMKVCRGTGKEAAYQPLSQLGYFTKTQTMKPMASVGGGVKFALTRKVFLRTEFRDYITAFPKEIITPPAGMKYGTMLHDLVPMAGLGFAMRSRVSLSLRPIPAATPQGVPAGIFLCPRAPPPLRHPYLPRPCLAE